MSDPGNATQAGALPFGSITDVAGIEVGHHQRTGRGWQTGTTVVVARGGATPGVDVRGAGPGTRETDALAPENLVEQIHAVCLTGGSAFGLAAADGVVAWCADQGLGFPVGTDRTGGPLVVPVVPAAVIFDLGRGGDPGHRPDASFGRRAAAGAKRSQQRWGTVGAGTGARAGGLQGGVGTASSVVTLPDSDTVVTVGALAVVNANGSPLDPASGRPWFVPGGTRIRTPSAAERAALRAAMEPPRPEPLNTTIGVVATDAWVTKAEARRLATVAHDGLARAIRPAHSMVDGDTVFALATGARELPDAPAEFGGARRMAYNLVLATAADVFAAACTHAILAARGTGETAAYHDLCPAR